MVVQSEYTRVCDYRWVLNKEVHMQPVWPGLIRHLIKGSKGTQIFAFCFRLCSVSSSSSFLLKSKSSNLASNQLSQFSTFFLYFGFSSLCICCLKMTNNYIILLLYSVTAFLSHSLTKISCTVSSLFRLLLLHLSMYFPYNQSLSLCYLCVTARVS